MAYRRRIDLRVSDELFGCIKDAAADDLRSVNAWILAAIVERLERKLMEKVPVVDEVEEAVSYAE